MRKKLIELLNRVQSVGVCRKPSDFDDRYWVLGSRSNEEVADHLIANGVTVSEGALPAADAVIIPDKKLHRAVNLLIKQYEHSKNSEYVHNPVAHALYHTWKQVDEGLKNDT